MNTSLSSSPISTVHRNHDQRALELAGLSGEMVLALLAASPDCVKLLSTNGVLDFMSYGGLCAMEIPDFARVSGLLWWDLWPQESRDRLKAAVRTAAAGGSDRFEAFCPTAAGTPKWWEVTVSPVLAGDGSVSRILSVSRDITEQHERTRALEEALAASELLRREVDHRVKNSLSMVSSLLRMQARQASPEAGQALKLASGRVQTIAQVHDMLHRSEASYQVDLETYLTELLTALSGSMADGVTLVAAPYSGPAVTLPPSDAAALGLAVAELVTNSLRHGALDQTGRIVLSMTHEAPTLEIAVEDSGTGLPKGFDIAQQSGIGMQVVRSMADQIGAELGFSASDAGGARFTLRFVVPVEN